jgi:hypothetical protein
MTRNIEQLVLWGKDLPPLAEIDTSFLYWNRPYGWRAGDSYIESGASAADVVRYEREVLHNEDIDTPEFLLEELDRTRKRANDVIWVCQTREDARQYVRQGTGQPYKEDFGSHALILATDNEPQTGYLLLSDASLLSKSVLIRFGLYRQRFPFQEPYHGRRARFSVKPQ